MPTAAWAIADAVHTTSSLSENVPIAAPLLERAALRAAEILRDIGPAFRPAEMSLFCDAEEKAVLASIYVNDAATRSLINS